MKFSGAQPELMHFKKISPLIRSFIIIPVMATTLSMSTFTASINSVLSQKDVPNAEEVALQQEREENAAKIDAYFAQFNLPLAGHGMTFVIEAENSGIPWSLLPAIAMAESTGCKYVIPGTNNCFGWGSGKIKFDSIDQAITIISSHLGGNNPVTAKYYDGKTVEQILKAYNPPRIAPGYTQHVINIMKRIEQMTA
ncbi:MAG TPA: hypothetical protein VG982_00225 [Candidatus Paceibacterota bacterium]|nr:hypothetical protein [Candidatus Paceibacterota bacterium]